ncbi:MAG: 50S ribosomal protein L1 [Candidatus Heimdallarchaeota archaeon]
MSYTSSRLEEAISQAKTKSQERRKRNFEETVEISIGLRDLDLKNPSNRINLETIVPNDLGAASKSPKVAVFAEGDLAVRTNDLGLRTIGREEIEQLSKEPKSAKKLANEFAFFLAQPQLMAVVARFLGKVLGPRGKMPKPIPPRTDLQQLVNRYDRTVKLRLKSSPVINAPIGKAGQPDKDLAENASTIIQAISGRLPKGMVQVKSVSIKTTMGPTVKLAKN